MDPLLREIERVQAATLSASAFATAATLVW